MHPSEQVEAPALWEMTLYLPRTAVRAGVAGATAQRCVVTWRRCPGPEGRRPQTGLSHIPGEEAWLPFKLVMITAAIFWYRFIAKSL